MKLVSRFTFIFLLIISVNSLFAQQQKVVADKIIAKVGDKIILKSDIDNAIADYKRQGQDAELPENPDCSFLEGQLIQKILVLQAEKDSVQIGDDEVDALLDNQVRYFIQQMGSQEVLEQVAGKTVYQLKEDLRPTFRDNKLAEKMRGQILENVKITPTEVKNYFDKIPKDSLPYYESQLEVSEIIVHPQANKDIEAYITNQLNDMKKQVESGQRKFADLAKIYSQDPGSKDNGGQYSMNRNEKQWDPVFLSAAFKLKEGQVSPVIKTQFGLHIIQMVSRAGDDAVIRHILIMPSVTDEETNTAKSKLDSARSKIIAGNMSFGEAVNRYSDDDLSKSVAGQILAPDGSSFVTIDQLDKNIVVNLKNMKAGDISQPEVYTDERNRQAVRLIYLKSQTQPHRENMKDDYDRIAQRALAEKKNAVLSKWFQDHIPDYYVDIDKDYLNCSNINQYWKSATNNTAGN